MNPALINALSCEQSIKRVGKERKKREQAFTSEEEICSPKDPRLLSFFTMGRSDILREMFV